MQWDASKYAGFTSEDSAEPYIAANIALYHQCDNSSKPKVDLPIIRRTAGEKVRNHEKTIDISKMKLYLPLLSEVDRLRKDSEESDVNAYGDIEPLAQEDPPISQDR